MSDISTLTSVPDYPAVTDVKKDVVYGKGALVGTLEASGAPSVLKTGQTTSYADYDDGYYQKGNAVSPRFTDNGDGTVTDMATNLMWLKDLQHLIPGATDVTSDNLWVTDKGNWTNSTGYVKGDFAGDASTTYWVCAVNHTSAGGGSFADDRTANPTYWRQQKFGYPLKGTYIPQPHTWADSITLVEDLSFAGYSDWRMPNFSELVSICDFENGGLYSVFFAPAAYMGFWTSTTQKRNTGYAKVIEVWSSAIMNIYPYFATQDKTVITYRGTTAVRGIA